jgi:DNA repair exonuclease SbcCD ATPase subunit
LVYSNFFGAWILDFGALEKTLWKSPELSLMWRQRRAFDKKFVMPDKIRPIEQMLELSEEESLSPEHLDEQVQKAQEQLLQLKRQQEQNEKQKRELEELSRRQEELGRGRAEMTDKLTRSLVVLEREAYDAQKRLEQLRAMRESFGQHLKLIEGIDPKSWNPAELHKELSRALSAVDDARAEFSQQRSRLQASGASEADEALPEAAPGLSQLGGGGRSLWQWVQIGFGLTLPLIIFGFIALFIFFWMAATTR